MFIDLPALRGIHILEHYQCCSGYQSHSSVHNIRNNSNLSQYCSHLSKNHTFDYQKKDGHRSPTLSIILTVDLKHFFFQIHPYYHLHPSNQKHCPIICIPCTQDTVHNLCHHCTDFLTLHTCNPYDYTHQHSLLLQAQ